MYPKQAGSVGEPITAMTCSPSGETLFVTAGNDGTIKLWNIPWIHSELAAIELAW
jgi:WD40 repeat protein